MEPFRIITTPEGLAALTISTIVCPVRQPGLAYRKAWSDLFTTFESPKEWDSRETWTILTMHCPGDKQRAGSFDFIPHIYPGLSRSDVSWRISDHYPLWCEFLID